jgi:hypothetical protein
LDIVCIYLSLLNHCALQLVPECCPPAISLQTTLPVQTQEGYRYCIIFVDDAHRFWVVILLWQKSEAFQAFLRFKAFAERLTGCKIGSLCDDKGGEYMSSEWEDLCAAEGIQRQHTVRNEPHQNGIAEQANRTLAEGATLLLIESHLSPSFWGLAIASFVHVHNRMPSSALPAGATPYSGWCSEKPSVERLRVFGCTAYVNIQKDKQKGLVSHSEKCIFAGYVEQYKAWLFCNPDTKKRLISNAAIFDERYFPGARSTDSWPTTTPDHLLSSPSVSTDALALVLGGDN